MKKIILSIIVMAGAIAFTGCKKVEGKGGTSSVTGNVSGTIIKTSGSNVAEQEVTAVICNHADGVGGSILNNSDYFLLNTPSGPNYYVWYENTNWLGQDPGLSGRTGIKVTYSNSDSNVTIASNTAAAITANASSDFTVSVSNDVVTITNVTPGEVIDADNANTPFAIDALNQGKNASSGSTQIIEGPIAEERVYLIYGEEDFYSESVRTDEDGNYQFTGLTKGTYRVYAFSHDIAAPNGALFEVTVNAEITDNKQVVKASDIIIVK